MVRHTSLAIQLQAVREFTVSGTVQTIHLHVKEGEDHGPLLCVHVSTQKRPLVQSSCPAEAWNAVRLAVNSKGESKPASRFAKLFGLSHTDVFQKLVVRLPSPQDEDVLVK